MFLPFKFILQIVLAVFLLSGCYTSISKIKTKPDQFQGKNIKIKGVVISSLDLMDINCFTLRDRRAHILIVTENLLPLKGDKIKVKGVVEKNYKYNKRNLLVIVEKKMKLQKPEKSKKILDKNP